MGKTCFRADNWRVRVLGLRLRAGRQRSYNKFESEAGRGLWVQ